MLKLLNRKAAQYFKGYTKGPIMGIDFGNTHCSMACVEGDQFNSMRVTLDKKRIPNAVAFNKEGEKLVGVQALIQSLISPENAVLGIKNFMGMKYDDLVLQDRIKKQPFKVVKHYSQYAWIEIMGKAYSPSQIASQVILKLKQEAQRQLKKTVDRAIIAVPAQFNHYQCKAIRYAGQLAGFQVQGVIPQHIAASMPFCRQNEENIIAVYDFGQRFNISIIKQEDYAQTKATVGDQSIGGSEFDKIIQNFFVQQFQRQSGLDISSDKMALQRLRKAAEKAKIQLSSQPQTLVAVPCLAADNLGPKHFSLKFTRTKLEALAQDILRKTIQLCEKSILDAKIEKNQIDKVVLAGGMSHMPKVVELVEKCFGKSCYVNPNGGVALGTAFYANYRKQSLDKMDFIIGYTPPRAYQLFQDITIKQPQVQRQIKSDKKHLGLSEIASSSPSPSKGRKKIQELVESEIIKVKAKDQATGNNNTAQTSIKQPVSQTCEKTNISSRSVQSMENKDESKKE